MSIGEVRERIAGMGALPHAHGVAFRVWAPHATRVAVKGTFNDWASEGIALDSEGNGYWYVDVDEASAGDEYLFLVKNGDQEFERIDPYAREVKNSTGPAVVADPTFDWEGDDFELPPKNELVIYEMHIGTFGIDAAKGRPGTLEAAKDQLRYLQKLGVNCIEVMPLAEFAGDFSWGYNPAHIFAVESAYGGPNAFKEFVREAHRLKIGVILDVVYNHFGPSDLSLWQFDGWSENGLGGIYFYNDWRAETPWGQTRPDYGRPEVRQYIRDNALMWLEDYHCDGLRLDMTLYLRNVYGNGDPGADLPDGWSLTQWISQEVHERCPRALVIAEDLHNNSALTRKVEAGGAGFDAQWDAQFVHPVRALLIEPQDEARSLDAACGALFANYNGDPFERVVYTESHDEVANGKARVPAEVMPTDSEDWFALKRATLGTSLVLTAPGIPMLFQGQEFLEGGWFRDTVPLDWEKAGRFDGLVRMCRDLIALRLNRQGQTRGLTGSGVSVLHADHTSKALVLHRWHSHGPGDDVVLVCNFQRESQEVPVPFPATGTWTLLFHGDAHFYSEEFQNSGSDEHAKLHVEGETEPPRVVVGPYSLMIYSHNGD